YASPTSATQVMSVPPPLPTARPFKKREPWWSVWGLLLLSFGSLIAFAVFLGQYVQIHEPGDEQATLRWYTALAGALFFIGAAFWVARRRWPLVLGMVEAGLVLLVLAGIFFFDRPPRHRSPEDVTVIWIICLVAAVALCGTAALVARRRWPAIVGGFSA